MDWSKTKTILIMTLIVVNVFLLYVYIESNEEPKIRVSEEIISILNSKGITLEEKDYQFPREIHKVFVTYEAYSEGDIKRLLGQNYMRNNALYLNKDYYLEIDDENILTYSKRGLTYGDNKMSEDDAIRLGRSFLESSGFFDQTVVLKNIEKNGDYLQLNYIKKVDERFIEDSYMTLSVFNDRIISLTRKWLSHDISDNAYHPIISLDKALYKFETKITPVDPITVEDVSLGYVLESDIFLQNLQSGEAFPYFKFTLSNGRDIYVEAMDN